MEQEEQEEQILQAEQAEQAEQEEHTERSFRMTKGRARPRTIHWMMRMENVKR